MDRSVVNYKATEYDNALYYKVYSTIYYSRQTPMDCKRRFVIIISHNAVYMVSYGSTLLNSENVNANKRTLNGFLSGRPKVNDISTRY